MVNFADLKKNSKSQLESLKENLEKLNSKAAYGDDRFWKVTRDKAGNGRAIIRFLPAPGAEDVPFIRQWSHSFKGPTGQYYIEQSLTTIGLDDPVSEYNTELWNSVDSDDTPERKQARKQKRALSYISNIYVIKDPGNPENEGKVFLFKYGKKIFDRLNMLMNPEYEGDAAINPFDLWNGCNFRLSVQVVDDYPNYDKSTFDPPSPLLDDDEKLEEIWKSEYPLAELNDPSKFKSYDELKVRLHRVLSLDQTKKPSVMSAEDDTPKMDFKPNFKERKAPVADEAPFDIDNADPDDGDEEDFFANLKKLAE